MKQLLAFMLIPFCLAPLLLYSSEKSEWSNEMQYSLISNVATDAFYFDKIPNNPNLYHSASSYKDSNLTAVSHTIKPNSKITITGMIINDNLIPVFVLSDGTYIEASHQIIYDDIVYSQEKVDLDYWLEEDFKVYNQPLVYGSKEVKSSLTSYTQIHLTEKAVTEQGVYYKVSGKGWISEDYLSVTDNRMKKIQNLLTQKYNQPNYSIFVKQLNTQKSAGINENTKMYAASVAKLATLYYTQEQIQDGKLKFTDKLKYISEVNNFKEAYNPSGSGKISKTADNKEYNVENLLKAVAQNSDNVATNILGYYVAEQYDKDFQDEIDALSGMKWDMKERNISAEAAANMMEAIYYQDGKIIEYLSSTDYDDSRIAKDISVQVSHKIGDAYDYKHDVAIIYAEEPYIVSIFTDKASYDDITRIADDIYAVLK
ncbi:serine hydrolase [Streptococcus pantholopis]|uniref:Serine hydrolase n=1 Tax=Streptococcus pantholopis TaxID=1811193 RepID=A0A172Q9Z2_9STRE|nr:serine hydrolase [Streptococcus pantholopis]AND80252.1 serine hydrolase [Streptococcus pantholopis]